MYHWDKKKRIPGFPNYSVTRDGRVWSKKRTTTKGGWLRPSLDAHGYWIVSLCIGGTRKTRTVHQLVLETYVGLCPEGMVTRHLNGNRTDNHLKNLRWGTHTENIQDAIRHGTSVTCKKGEESPTSKISNRDRRLIIYQYSTGIFTHRELAKIYGVGKSTVTRLVSGMVWPFVDARKIREVAHV